MLESYFLGGFVLFYFIFRRQQTFNSYQQISEA